MNAKSRLSKRTWTDPDDAPEITKKWLAEADLYEGEKLIRRGRGRPVGSLKSDAKQPVKLRLDADVLAALRASGNGWQTRINEALRASLALSGTTTP